MAYYFNIVYFISYEEVLLTSIKNLILNNMYKTLED